MAIRTERLGIEGMHCGGCEATLEDALRPLDGIKDVAASLSNSSLVVRYDDDRLRLSRILAIIEDKGYLATGIGGVAPPETSLMASVTSVAKFILVLAAVGGLVYWGIAIMPGVMAQMRDPAVGYGMLVLVGFLTGFHCIGMCGSFVVSYTTGGEPRTWPSLLLAHAAYGFGKTLSYATLGALFGGLGAILTISANLRAALALASGVYLVLWGIRMLKLFSGMKWLDWAFPRALMRGVQSGIRQQPRPLVIGLCSGFLLGCGALQAMYVLAAGTGSPREGALLLASFGLGTLGPLLGFGLFAHLLSRRVLSELLRVSGLLVLIMGLMMIDRGLRLNGSGYDFASLRDRWVSFTQELRHDPSGHGHVH